MESTESQPVQLHLGCGKKKLPGFIHVDLLPYDHIDYKCDVGDMTEVFSNEVADEIYACHVLEHFPRCKILLVLSEWNRILKQDGLLRICVPDFQAVVKQYQHTGNLSQLQGVLYGGQRDQLDYHQTTFDFSLLQCFLEDAGFNNVRCYDWRDFLPKGYDDYSRSYLPHMDESGRLMSLNVVATKCGAPKHKPSERVCFAMGTHRPWNVQSITT